MGYETIKRPIAAQKGIEISTVLDLPIESLTSSTALQTLSAHGVSFLTASTGGGGRDFKLPAPPQAGAVKLIYVDQSGSTAPEVVRIVTATTAAVFWASTFNEVACAGSTANPAGSPMLVLVAKNTTTWAVGVGSTSSWDFSASTGSTGQ